MKQYLYQVLRDSGTLTVEQIITYIFMAAVISCIIYLSYYLTHEGTLYSKKFNVSLIMLTVLTGTVMTVIGNNVALSLGMVGALSIVRFRTAIKDSRDTAYIFWSIVVGICCGVGDFVVAAIGSAITFVVLSILGKIKDNGRVLLIIKAERKVERTIEGLIFSYFEGKLNLKVKNTTKETIEFIYELSKKSLDKTLTSERNITELLYEIDDVNYVNIVTQNDEISG